MQIIPLANGIGAEVIELDLENPIAEADQQALQEAWLDKGILLFREIGDSPEKQLALSRVFGELEVHPIENIRLEGYPELIWLANKDRSTSPVYLYDGKPTVSRIPWHSDLVYTTTPNRGALLRMVNMPEQGGDTGWIDTAAAYEGLSDEIKQRIDGLEARFEFIIDPQEIRFGRPDVKRDETDKDTETAFYPDFPPIAHPLVWTHQVSGKKSLNVSTLHLREVIGMDREEGDALLHQLVAHTTQAQFSYDHHWQPNDMVLWDNWRTMHRAQGHPPELKRLVHRTTIKGEHSFGRVI
ncbi:MAG: TauD/TfdA family dioxygenase [Pseudomonadales bacterium]